MSKTVPSLANFELRAGDCVEGLKKLPAECVDVVMTSPPYNLGIDYSAYRDDKSQGDYMDWCLAWAAELKRVMKPAGSFFLNIGASPSNPLLPHQIVIAFQPLFRLQNTIHWIKSITVRKPNENEISIGHFKPINSKRYLTDCHEYVFHLTKTGDVPIDRLAIGARYADKSNIGRWKHTEGNDRRCRGNNWFVAYRTIRDRKRERPHPATFPIGLAENCIRLHGLRTDMVVLDPFVGIGNSALAAQRCRVGRFIGFDIDEGYLEEARKRLEAEML